VLTDALNHREQRLRPNLKNDIGQKPRSVSICLHSMEMEYVR
jgi:hypothetical protein